MANYGSYGVGLQNFGNWQWPYAQNGFQQFGLNQPQFGQQHLQAATQLSDVRGVQNSVPYGSDYFSPDGYWPRYTGAGLYNRYGAFLGRK